MSKRAIIALKRRVAELEAERDEAQERLIEYDRIHNDEGWCDLEMRFTVAQERIAALEAAVREAPCPMGEQTEESGYCEHVERESRVLMRCWAADDCWKKGVLEGSSNE